MNKIKPTLVGGVGEKLSNGGTQWYQQNRIYDSNQIALCISAHASFNPYYEVKMNSLRIRKLTPKECWRLMGMCKRREDGTFDDSPFELAQQVNSNSKLYAQAGNSIVVDVLEAIFKQLL